MRLRLRWVALFAIFVFVAASCGDAAVETTAAPSETTASTSETTAVPSETTAPEASGGVLLVGEAQDILSTEPHLLAFENRNIMWNVYETLIHYDDSLVPQPVLATKWEWSDDLTQLTFHLREDVRFHDGKAFTSQDVKWSIERVADPATGAAQLEQSANWITDIALPDDHTVVLSLDMPRPTIMDLFNLMNIADENTVEGPNAATTVNGTGPYVFTEWETGVQITLTKNEDYWDPSRPKVDEVQLIVVPDTETLLIQLESGAVDVAEGLTPEQAIPLKESGFEVQGGYAGTRYVVANADYPGTGGDENKLVRQAINYAIDRQRIQDEVLLGTGHPTSTFWPVSSPAYDEEQATRYTFDLDKAQQLLDQAGVSDLELDIIVTAAFVETVPIAQILQSDLAKIGITLNVQLGDVETWREHYTTAIFDGLLTGPYSFNQYDPASLFTIARVFSKTANPAGFDSEEYNELVARSSGETDPEARAQAIHDTAEWLLDQSYIMPVVLVDTLAAMAPNISTTANVVSNRGGGLVFERFVIEG
jgi:peptide/nickel transport system substrate-binding protein